MSTHNLCFRAKIRKKRLPLYFPSFTIQKWSVRGYSLHGLVFVMMAKPLSLYSYCFYNECCLNSRKVQYKSMFSFKLLNCTEFLLVDSDSGARSRGLDTYLRRVVSLSRDTFTPRKVLVIPRKRWLRPDMTEKLLTGTLCINTVTNKQTNLLVE